LSLAALTSSLVPFSSAESSVSNELRILGGRRRRPPPSIVGRERARCRSSPLLVPVSVTLSVSFSVEFSVVSGQPVSPSSDSVRSWLECELSLRGRVEPCRLRCERFREDLSALSPETLGVEDDTASDLLVSSFPSSSAAPLPTWSSLCVSSSFSLVVSREESLGESLEPRILSSSAVWEEDAWLLCLRGRVEPCFPT